jgi:predicted metal-dependent phosphoesterase TrpH
MRAKGALHVHSTLSRDGTMTIPNLARFYREKGYDFIAMGEHSEDLDTEKIQILQEQCASNSDNAFCVIPGLEFTCRGGFHIFGMGAVGLTRDVDPLAVVAEIHALNGLAILAHPSKYRWDCLRELLCAVDAAEIWNVQYDGKYLPSFRAPRAFERMQRANPLLLAIAGHDFHGSAGFYDVSIEMEVETLRPGGIFERIRQGSYLIKSRFFRAEPHPRFSWASAAGLTLMSGQLAILRWARDLLVRWST